MWIRRWSAIKQRILVSELAGRATVLKKAAEMGIDLAGDETRRH